jgi:hypothetical protein
MKSIVILSQFNTVEVGNVSPRASRAYSRHVKLHNWAARHGYRFWSRAFNLFNL